MDLEYILVELQDEHGSMTNLDHYAQRFVSYCLKKSDRM